MEALPELVYATCWCSLLAKALLSGLHKSTSFKQGQLQKRIVLGKRIEHTSLVYPLSYICFIFLHIQCFLVSLPMEGDDKGGKIPLVFCSHPTFPTFW